MKLHENFDIYRHFEIRCPHLLEQRLLISCFLYSSPLSSPKIIVINKQTDIYCAVTPTPYREQHYARHWRFTFNIYRV